MLCNSFPHQSRSANAVFRFRCESFSSQEKLRCEPLQTLSRNPTPAGHAAVEASYLIAAPIPAIRLLRVGNWKLVVGSINTSKSTHWNQHIQIDPSPVNWIDHLTASLLEDFELFVWQIR